MILGVSLFVPLNAFVSYLLLSRGVPLLELMFPFPYSDLLELMWIALIILELKDMHLSANEHLLSFIFLTVFLYSDFLIVSRIFFFSSILAHSHNTYETFYF